MGGRGVRYGREIRERRGRSIVRKVVEGGNVRGEGVARKKT